MRIALEVRGRHGGVLVPKRVPCPMLSDSQTRLTRIYKGRAGHGKSGHVRAGQGSAGHGSLDFPF